MRAMTRACFRLAISRPWLVLVLVSVSAGAIHAAPFGKRSAGPRGDAAAPRGRTSCCPSPTTSRPSRGRVRRHDRPHAELRPHRARRRAVHACVCASPSCTPSRAALLSGQAVHRLEGGGPPRVPSRRLRCTRPARAGGLRGRPRRQGLGTGQRRGRRAGAQSRGAGATRALRGSSDAAAGRQAVLLLARQLVPAPSVRTRQRRAGGTRCPIACCRRSWPSTDAVRADLLAYYAEVERFDAQVFGDAPVAAARAARAVLDDTLLVVTSDNGMPFPRGKSQPLRHGNARAAGRALAARSARAVTPTKAFAGLADLAPTFLEAAGVPVPAAMTGAQPARRCSDDRQHRRPRPRVRRARTPRRTSGAADSSYPVRAIRTKDYLYIRNFRAESLAGWCSPSSTLPSGRSVTSTEARTKSVLLDRRDDPAIAPSSSGWRRRSGRPKSRSTTCGATRSRSKTSRAGRTTVTRSGGSAPSWTPGCAKPATRG